MKLLDEIKTRLAEASKGPWHVIGTSRLHAGVNVPAGYIVTSGTRRKNAVFIANARLDLEACVTALERIAILAARPDLVAPEDLQAILNEELS